MSSSSSNVVGVHYRVGKKIGEGSFGVIFEGTNLLNNQQVAIKFVSLGCPRSPLIPVLIFKSRNHAKAMLPNCEMNTGPTRSSSAAVSSFATTLLVQFSYHVHARRMPAMAHLSPTYNGHAAPCSPSPRARASSRPFLPSIGMDDC
jgi:hypothetical protein